MRSVRILVVLTAALLCVAATGLAHQGPGLAPSKFLAGQHIEVGTVHIHNNGKDLNHDGEDVGSKLMIHIDTNDFPDWKIVEVQIYVGPEDGEIPMKKGNPKLGHFPYKEEYSNPVPEHTLVLDLEDDLDFSWGQRSSRIVKVAVHADVVKLDAGGNVIQEEGAWAWAGEDEAKVFGGSQWGWWLTYELAHPRRGHLIDKPVKGYGYITPTHAGIAGDDENGGFWFFPGEWIDLFIGKPTYDSTWSFYLGTATAGKKISPLDLFYSGDTGHPGVIGVARVLQTLDSRVNNGAITIEPGVAACFNGRANALGFDSTMLGDAAAVEAVLQDTVDNCRTLADEALILVSADDAKGNLEAGLNASGIFRKNISKTEDWGETKQKLEVMPVYLPPLRSNGEPSCCEYAEDEVTCLEEGVAYEEWRLNGDPAAGECDPRIDGDACLVTLIECRDVAKPLLVTYLEKIDIYDDQVTTDFWGGRFSWDVYTSISRDDGTTWKRRNVSRMADMSSFDLETGEPFPGTSGSPYLKIDDNYILNVWESKFCKSGNPRYSITTCDDPDTPEIETPDTGCQVVCSGPDDPDHPEYDPDKCGPDYPFDDGYFVTDIWGVRGKQRSVDYDEVDDVAELGIGEIPYSCLWAARGVIVTQKELDAGTFASLTVDDNLDCTGFQAPYECCTGLGTGTCEVTGVELGDIVWFKPERITSGRRDAYLPMTASARGAGFAIAWQEDPAGLRPGKGKGPGEGWSGAISNHKTDIWYTFIKAEDFAKVDENFVPSQVRSDPNGDDPGFDDNTGLGRPQALVPFALPVRVTDNDMVNTNSLKVEPGSECVTPPGGTDPVCFPEVVDDGNGGNTFVPLDPDAIADQFCDPGDPVASGDGCCHPEHHHPDDPQYDMDCEGMQGLYGNLNGTKRYAYMAATIDEIDNATGLYTAGGDGFADYAYYEARGGTLDLCDTTDTNSYMDELPGTSAHERWFGFTNANLSSKLVCVSSDGRLLDGDVFAVRPMLKLNGYTKTDGTKSAWAQLAYEESKGMGHSLAAAEQGDDGDEILGEGQDKPIKQDIGKNLIYHSFDFAEPDLVAPGHIVNLPALCGGIYPNYCGETYDGTNPTCTCIPGEPVPLYFDYQQCADPADPATCEWMPDDTRFLQYRTEIARRARFIMQSPSKMGASKTLGTIIFKQGQEGQGRPADVFIRRWVKTGTGNPYKFENLECTTYLDETFTDLPGCPTDGVKGYNCNIWGEAAGDRLCGGVFDGGGYLRRDHVNLTSHDIDMSVWVGPPDDTPDDTTDDIYTREKVLLWTQNEYNLGDESFGYLDGTTCDREIGDVCPGMYSNARSHRGFIRGDLLVTAFSWSPNWAAGRNGNDRYNFYVRKSFDGGQTWTTTPGALGGSGTAYCREYRTDPNTADDDGVGNAPPVYDGFDPECSLCAEMDEDLVCTESDSAELFSAGAFQPARNISRIRNNHESSGDPRIGATPPTAPLDGRVSTQPVLKFVEDKYQNNIFFVAWGTVDNAKSTGSTGVKSEGSPLDLFYTRTEDYGDTFLQVPWNVNPQGNSDNWEEGELVLRYDHLAKGEPEEQGECQFRATPDGSKAYAIFHSAIGAEEDPNEIPTRWYPWKPEESSENDLWFRRLIFWPDTVTTP